MYKIHKMCLLVQVEVADVRKAVFFHDEESSLEVLHAGNVGENLVFKTLGLKFTCESSIFKIDVENILCDIADDVVVNFIESDRLWSKVGHVAEVRWHKIQ